VWEFFDDRISLEPWSGKPVAVDVEVLEPPTVARK
jgi:hypothetical protein